MSVLSTVVFAAEEKLAPLIAPNWVFPLIAVAVFIALGFVIHSFRDVANRHSHKTSGGSAHAASGHTTDH